MPTENRSSNTEMVSVPPFIGLKPLVGRYYPARCRRCGWVGSSEELTEDDAQCTRDIGDRLCLGDCDELERDDLLSIIQAMAQSAERHQGEPAGYCRASNLRNLRLVAHCAAIEMTGVPRREEDIPLYTHPAPAVQKGEQVAYRHIDLDGEKGMWFDAHPDSLKSARDDVERGVYGKVELAYGVADAGEVERLRNCLRTEIDAGDSWKREAEDLRAQLAEMTKSYESLAAVYAGTQKGFERLQAQLAERDALLFRLAYYLAPALEANAPYMSAETMHDALSALNEHRKLLAAARSSNTEPVDPDDRKFGSMTARFAVEAMGALTKS